MLRKPALVTVIPGVAPRAYRAATHNCYSVPPPGIGGDGAPPPPPPLPPAGGITVTPGTAIVLETANGSGGYDISISTAPAPAGYTCRYETVMVSDLDDPTHLSTTYNIVCSGG